MEIALALLKKFWPYIVAVALGAAIGGKVAWMVQGVRIDAAKADAASVRADFEQYKADQIAAKNEADRVAEKQRAEAAVQYANLKGELKDEIAKGEVFKRCVAAGKCGALVVRVPVESGCSAGIRIPPASGFDGAGAHAVPLDREPAAEVANDCAVTTLMLNRLQADIEAQPGYLKSNCAKG